MTVKFLHGDCRKVLLTIPDRSIHCVVTSPPYFQLRDYQHPDQIGMEADPSAFVAEIVAVFREIWRVLRNDGTVWLVLGDSYASNGGSGNQGTRGQRCDRRHTQEALGDRRKFPEMGIKPKDLMGIPWQTAFALRDDGWYLRSGVVWDKPNAMPEAVTDRPTTAHEFVFLLTKSGDSQFWTHREGACIRKRPAPDYRWSNNDSGIETAIEPENWRLERSAKFHDKKLWSRINLWAAHDYYYDAEAIREDGSEDSAARYAHPFGGQKSEAIKETVHGRTRPVGMREYTGTRNRRSVWTIPTVAFKGAHFATFPPDLAEICIKAGTSARGCCQACGAPWVRKVTKGEPDREHQIASGARADGSYTGQSTKRHDAAGVQNASDVKRRILEGMRHRTSTWHQGCGCAPAKPVPCTVLDPFGGAGTTALVGDRLGQNVISIELNPDYIDMATKRVTDDASLFADIQS